MKRLRELTALVLLVLLFVVPLHASAASADGHGWWWRAQAGLLGAELPPPPDVPESGLLVERGPDGATAVAAVRFVLEADERDPVLTLAVASQQGGGTAAIAACPTGTTWTDVHGGRWDTAPLWDCAEGRVDGVRSEDGASWTWELAPLLSDRTIDVMLVDGTPTPFHIAFEAPTDASLATVRSSPPAPTPQPSPPAPPPAPIPGQEQGGSEPPTFGPPPTVVVPAPVGVGDDPPPPAPEVAAPGPAPVAPTGPPVAAPVPEPARLTPLAFALMLAIVLLLAVDLVAGRPTRASLAAWRRPEPTGGIGRFARPREEPPAPLW